MNEMNRRIVVGIAEEQPATLHFAVAEARRTGLDLEVVHCAGDAPAAMQVLEDARAAVLREPDPPPSHFRMSDATPIDELLQVSTEAAEIVIGSDNPSWFSRLLSPAVAQTLAFSARCPVVVVPEKVPGPPWARGVVVGIEAVRPEEHVLRFAFEQADRRGCELQVLHALPVDAWVGELEAHEAAIAEALAGWREKFPDVLVTRRFVQGDPTRVCTRATMRAELVVIGQPHGDRVPFGLGRPMSDALLQRANGPVAIVPDPIP